MKSSLSTLRTLCPMVIVLLEWLLCPSRSPGQGTISFGNPTPIYDVDGKTPLAGPAFLAELYAAVPGNSLEPISASITPFTTFAPGYFFNPVDVVVPGVPIGGTAALQVVAWRASDGPTFETANHPGGHVGASAEFGVRLSGGLGPPASLSGMDSFSLQVVVPEPPVSALALVGGVAFMLWQVRQRTGKRKCCARSYLTNAERGRSRASRWCGY